MDFAALQTAMKELGQTANWRTLVGLIEDRYRGMFVMLNLLRDSDGAVVAGDFAKRMGVSTARVASALNTLEGKGFVRRERDETDARRVVIRMTEEGEKALEERKAYINATLAPMLDKLTAEEAETLIRLLAKLLK